MDGGENAGQAVKVTSTDEASGKCRYGRGQPEWAPVQARFRIAAASVLARQRDGPEQEDGVAGRRENCRSDAADAAGLGRLRVSRAPDTSVFLTALAV